MKTFSHLTLAAIAILISTTGIAFAGDSQPTKRHHTIVTSTTSSTEVTIALAHHGQIIQEPNGDFEQVKHVTGPQGQIITYFAPVR
jgi:hypothetical protein